MIAGAIRNSRRAVIPYVTAGLRGIDVTGEMIMALADAGAAPDVFDVELTGRTGAVLGFERDRITAAMITTKPTRSSRIP